MCSRPLLFGPTVLLIQQLLKTFHADGVEEVQKTGPQTWEQMALL